MGFAAWRKAAVFAAVVSLFGFCTVERRPLGRDGVHHFWAYLLRPKRGTKQDCRQQE